MDDLLKPVSTVTIRRKPDVGLAPSDTSENTRPEPVKVSSPDDALNILKNHPTSTQLSATLNYLKGTAKQEDGFNICVPEPRTTQIAHALVNGIIPSYWSTFDEEMARQAKPASPNSLKASLVGCLRSLPGMGSILARLKSLLAAEKADKLQKGAIIETLDLLQEVLDIYTLVDDVRIGALAYSQSQTKRTLYWKEIISLRTSGKIVAIAAQAEDSVKEFDPTTRTRWIANGAHYATWLGGQLGHAISFLARESGSPELEGIEKILAQFAGKSMNLGYPNDTVREYLKELCSSKLYDSDEVGALVKSLRTYEQLQFADAVLFVLAENKNNDKPALEDASGAAGAFAVLIGRNESIFDHLVGRLVQEGPKIYGESIFTLRLMLAIVSTDAERMSQVMERSMKRFGDKLYIKHSPLLAQEALAQVLLVSAGYIHRMQPMLLFTIARSSFHNAGVSNRLAATSSRARFLGMIVGTAISQLVDKADAKLNFEVEELDTEEASWYQRLILTDDSVGDGAKISNFLERKWPKPTAFSDGLDLALVKSSKSTREANKNGTNEEVQQTALQKSGPSKIQTLDTDDEDDDLIPFAKPDSDPEDDDEDPTLVNRNRPSAPVYIRDLIIFLRDAENHDRHVLALRAAPSLIRRKANFGNEVGDHVIELANLFAGLGDHFELDDFAKLRLQSLVAVLIARPKEMGRWFAKAFFEGDYSISQRGAVLSAIGLSARELAGLENGDDLTGPAKEMSKAFPSKKLPEKFHKLYGGDDDPVARESKKLERGMMQPLALNAADKLSGPNALKVRTFSSRMDVEKKRKKPMSNDFANIVADSLFFPLTGRFQTTLQAHGRKSIQSSPHLLPLYLRTLTLVLHAAGPSAPSLPAMTSELFDLLLGLRGHAMQDDNVLEALLFALLTVLDLNAGEDAATDGGRRLCTETGREMLEMQGWVEVVFERLNEKGAVGLTRAGKGKESKEEERVGMLAAGVLSRIGEIVKKFQRLLLGDMVAL